MSEEIMNEQTDGLIKLFVLRLRVENFQQGTGEVWRVEGDTEELFLDELAVVIVLGKKGWCQQIKKFFHSI